MAEPESRSILMEPLLQEAPSVLEGFEPDPRRAKELKDRRGFQLHVIEIPLLRLLGCLLVALLIFVHNQFVIGIPSGTAAWTFVEVSVAYCTASWILLWLLHGRLPHWDLPLVFLVLDLGLITFAVHLSGGSRSLLLPLYLFRVADQAMRGFRTALAFALAAPLVHLGMMAVASAHGAVFNWTQELGKAGIILMAGLYLALTSRVVEGLRNRTHQALRFARKLVEALDEKARALEEARAKAEGHSRAKSAFLAGMSHELRTPLNAILLYSELIQTEAMAREDSSLAEDHRKILGAGKHLLSLVNELLDLAKIESGKMTFTQDVLDLDILFLELEDGLHPAISARGNTLVREPFLDGPFLGDPLRIRQILINLLGNANKFTHQGTIHLRGLLREEGAGTWLRLEVQDTGIGIAQDKVERIFNAFEQAEEDTFQHYGGTGLGLSLCRGFTEAMGGRIGATSKTGEGSLFWVELPWKPAPGL